LTRVGGHRKSPCGNPLASGPWPLTRHGRFWISGSSKSTAAPPPPTSPSRTSNGLRLRGLTCPLCRSSVGTGCKRGTCAAPVMPDDDGSNAAAAAAATSFAGQASMYRRVTEGALHPPARARHTAVLPHPGGPTRITAPEPETDNTAASRAASAARASRGNIRETAAWADDDVKARTDEYTSPMLGHSAGLALGRAGLVSSAAETDADEL
jgi:hypothetical protein